MALLPQRAVGLGLLVGLHRDVGAGVVDGAVAELLDTGTGADGLVGDLYAGALAAGYPWTQACSIGSWKDEPAPSSVPPVQPAGRSRCAVGLPLLLLLPHPASATAAATAPTMAPVRVSLTSLFLLRRVHPDLMPDASTRR